MRSAERGDAMTDFLKVPCLTTEEVEALETDIEARIEDRKKAGLLTDREVREIEEMRLRPLPDIQDVQSVFESHLFSRKR
jgi:hypothetical protein